MKDGSKGISKIEMLFQMSNFFFCTNTLLGALLFLYTEQKAQ